MKKKAVCSTICSFRMNRNTNITKQWTSHKQEIGERIIEKMKEHVEVFTVGITA